MNNKIALSIIVPIYKVEAYLPRCIDSILAQTFTDLELILVDDGSPDNCGEICDAYAERDPRVIVLHNENGGPSAARNAGLDAARGTYIGFVDGDDLIHPQMFEILFNTLEETGADMAQCDFQTFSENELHFGSLDMDAIRPTLQLYDREEILRNFYPDVRYSFAPSVCTKLVRRTVYEHLRFPLGRFYEDSYLQIPMLDAARSAVRVPLTLYFYYQRPGSTMHSNYALWWAEDIDIISRNNLEFFRKRGDVRQERYALRDLFIKFCRDKLAVEALHPELRQGFRPIQRRFKKEFFHILRIPELCRMEKILLVCLFISPKLAEKLCRKYFPYHLHEFMR